MAKQIKTMNITITEKGGTFSSIFHKIKGKKEPSEIIGLRQVLSNEKARILHMVKNKKPSSIYELSKLLNRDFKAVRQDIRLLEKFGFIELISAHKKGRECLRPIIDIDQIIIKINL